MTEQERPPIIGSKGGNCIAWILLLVILGIIVLVGVSLWKVGVRL